MASEKDHKHPLNYVRKILIVVLATGLCMGQMLYGQHTIGLISGNYAGSAGTVINPSSIANSWLKADISLFSASGFVENNYFYLPAPEGTISNIITGDYTFPFFSKPYGKGQRSVRTYYNDNSPKNIFIQSRVTGPSAMFSLRDHVFAVRIGARAVSSTRQVPYDIANFSYYGMDFKPQQNIYFVRQNYNMASMAWYELNLSYATVLKRSQTNHWSAGITIGPALGYSGAYITGYDTRYIVYNDSILNVELLDAELGLALSFDYEKDVAEWLNPMVRGLGWGMDIGITWQFRDRHYQKKFPGNFYIKRFEDYKFKVGVSIIDIGWIRFSKNAEKHVYDNVSNNQINTNDMEYDNIRDELDYTSELFYGSPDASLRARRFNIYLPTAFSVQMDYHTYDQIYVNAMLIIPAWFIKPIVERPVVLAVTPRYETRLFEIHVPLVLYDYRYPRIGFAVRLAGLTIGSDNLGGFYKGSDITGADFYISYKVNFRNDGKHPFTSKGACFNDWRLELQKYRK
ncbi:MAG: hypothetical protein K0B08_10795 [Bacteroidales bacterium]|nr:hypothetical protein [Bacteroidales bacterium]